MPRRRAACRSVHVNLGQRDLHVDIVVLRRLATPEEVAEHADGDHQRADEKGQAGNGAARICHEFPRRYWVVEPDAGGCAGCVESDGGVASIGAEGVGTLMSTSTFLEPGTWPPRTKYPITSTATTRPPTMKAMPVLDFCG